MAISQGDKLPDATLCRVGAEGPETVQMADLLRGRKVVIFALPGAYTRTCDAAHLPSFMRNIEGFRAKGVDELICLSVNDPFVMAAWGQASGATDAGISMIGDAAAEFTKAVGMEFSAPPVGLYDRSKRYALMAEDGVVQVIHAESNPGECDISGGESLLAAL